MPKDETSGSPGVIPPEDRQKREQDLADVVNSTGDNLIDISAVEQPEVLRDTGGRRTASEFKEAFLKESPDEGTVVSCSPQSIIHSIIPIISQIQPQHLSADTKLWLERVSKEAQAALAAEPVVKLVGDLVLTFE